MEELLIALIQGIPQILGEMLKDIKGKDLLKLLSWSFDSLSDWPNLSEEAQTAWASVFQLGFGLGIGAFSVYLFHDVFLRWSAARLLLFATGPLMTGTLAAGTAYFHTANRRLALYCFLFLAIFVFGIDIPRFGYCHRPPLEGVELDSAKDR